MRNKQQTRKGVMKGQGNRIMKRFKRDWQLHLLILVPLIYLLIFHYWPIYGAQIAFRDFRPKLGIWKSEWVGLFWFEKFLNNFQFGQVFMNTLILSLYSIVIGFPLPILFALLLNVVPGKRFKQVTQTVSYIPHFLSVTVLVSIITLFFSPVNGLYGTVYRALGGEGIAYDFRNMAGSFRHIYVWSDVWQEMGWSAIIYVAALSAVSTELHEAAMIDGATRWQRVIHVDFPAILPTAGIMLILRCGSVLSVGFEKVFLMQTSLNKPTSEVISTYVYNMAMGGSSDFSYASAVGLFNSVINCMLLVVVNYVTKKITNKEVSLF